MTVERAYRTLSVGPRNGSAEVSQIALNRPDRRNAIGPEMINELRYALADADVEPAVRVVVLTGVGKAFCAGGDFAQMVGGVEDGALPPFPDPDSKHGPSDPSGGHDYGELLLAMCRFPKPIIARVNGHAMGGGLGLVAASTFAVAGRSAQLGTPEIEIGLFPMMITALLVRLVPRRRLIEMMLLGQRLEAHDAASLGLVHAAVPDDKLDDAVDGLCERLSKKAPLAMRHGLEAIFAQDALTLAEALPMLRDRFHGLLATDDAREGIAAFLERRAPRWTGT